MPTLEALIHARRSLPSPDLRRAIREDAGAAQVDVAHELGVSQRTVSRWEAGECSPTKDVLPQYVDLLERMRQAAR